MNGVANGVFTGDTLLGLNNAPWVDYSEQSIITGWTTYTTKIIKYKVIGNTILVSFSISGTSNNATTSFTMPYISTFTGTALNMCYGVDNGTANVCDGSVATTTSTVTFNRWSAATTRTATWTASGTKSIFGQMYYQIS